MNTAQKSPLRLALIGIALSLVTGSAFADRYDWGERNKYREAKQYRYETNQKNYRKHNQKHNHYRRGSSASYGFRDNDRRVINKYYRDQQYRGKCPPGLTKKKNRCQPQKHAKKWQRGKPIAKHTRYYELPNGLRHRLSQSQNHYRYVRVEDDILMVDIVTNIVVDALENILR